jgi:PEP-CTERM motif
MRELELVTEMLTHRLEEECPMTGPGFSGFSKRAVVGAAVLVFGLFLSAPRARADIFDLNNAANCTGTAVVNGHTYAGNLGGGLCAGIGTPFHLSALLNILSNGTIVLGAAGEGTDKFVVTNDIGPSFSFTVNSTGQNNSGIANNAQCQINGGATAFASACTVTGANGATTHLGAPQINGLVFGAIVGFSGPNLAGQTFNLEFVSMQGNSSVVVPEPGSLMLMGTGILSLAAGLKRKIFRRIR